MFRFLLLLLIPAVVFSTFGVDVSTRVTKSTWSCMKNDHNVHFAVVRVYQSSGHTDPNGAATINDARAAGIPYVDGYIFPCYSCGNAAKQMDDTINYLKNYGVYLLKEGETHDEILKRNLTQTLHTGEKIGVTATAGMLWIDVEGTSYWGSSHQSNTDFIVAMANEGKARGVSMGIYTSNSQWSPITGGSTRLSSYPLWYPHYDNSASFSDFYSFGGWTKPAIKQYKGTTTMCSAGVDYNYY